MNRNLDGVYFRIGRNGRYANICFSDMTPEERAVIMEGRSTEWLVSMCEILAKTIREIGDALNIEGEWKNEN